MQQQGKRAHIDQLADDIALCATRIDAATHQLLTHIRTFDEQRGWAWQSAKSCAAWLSWRIGLGAGAAREKVRVANALGKLPLIDAALEKGELSYSKVRAVTRVATAENEELLLHMARGATGAALEKVCGRFAGLDKSRRNEERRFVRRRHVPDGSVRIEVRLEADEATRFWQALRETKLALAASVSAEAPERAKPSMADAAVVMAERQLASPELDSAPSKPAASRRGRAQGAERRQLLVHLREDHLIDGNWIGELHDGTPLRGETLKRIGCDCGLVAAKLGERGNVLDIGRRRRTVSSSQWRALLTRQRHCCFPGCTHAVFLEAHHVEHWFDRGETNLDNLALLCHGHHVAVHEGGFTIAWDDDGQPRFREPDGRIIERVPAPPHLCGDALAALTRQQHQAGVHIDRTTSLPNWDGSPANVGGAVEALVRRTGREASRGVPVVSRPSARRARMSATAI
jgi:hypothetical protein